MSRTFRRAASVGAAAFLLASCGATGFDADLRGWMPGALSTADAAASAAPRPQPDDRGVITFPTYQVAVARSGDTIGSVAARLGVDAARLAQHNALPANAPLGAGQVLVLPQRVGASGAAAAPGGRAVVSDPFARQSARSTPSPAATTPQPASGPANPTQHVVVAGETAWSVARKYNVSVQDLAAWNGLPSSMTLRVGQRLIVPVAGQKAPDPAIVTTAPGSGSPTPRPPSAERPLPSETTIPVPWQGGPGRLRPFRGPPGLRQRRSGKVPQLKTRNDRLPAALARYRQANGGKAWTIPNIPGFCRMN